MPYIKWVLVKDGEDFIMDGKWVIHYFIEVLHPVPHKVRNVRHGGTLLKLNDLPCEQCDVYPLLLLRLLADKLEFTKLQIETYQRLVNQLRRITPPHGCHYYCTGEIEDCLSRLKQSSDKLKACG